jgi:hypothetical protein
MILATFSSSSCGKTTKSTLFTGKVQTQGHCGRQFRMANGTMSYSLARSPLRLPGSADMDKCDEK